MNIQIEIAGGEAGHAFEDKNGSDSMQSTKTVKKSSYYDFWPSQLDLIADDCFCGCSKNLNRKYSYQWFQYHKKLKAKIYISIRIIELYECHRIYRSVLSVPVTFFLSYKSNINFVHACIISCYMLWQIRCTVNVCESN